MTQSMLLDDRRFVSQHGQTIAAHPSSSTIPDLLFRARQAAQQWARIPVAQRLQRIRNLRDLIARDAAKLTKHFSHDLQRTAADTLTAEIIPLAEAARYLERTAEVLLRPRILSASGRPLWLSKVQIELRREPLGVVLVIGPSNYPLFLPGVQAMQALVAGNAVLLKPGRGAEPIATAFRRCAIEAGIPADAFVVLDESIQSAREALQMGVDKVVMTGSATSGISVLHDAAETLTPATVELSGCDAVFVCEDADLTKAVDAVLFGLRLNGGATCIAPRRIFVDAAIAERFELALLPAVQKLLPVRLPAPVAAFAKRLVTDALSTGATLGGSEPNYSPDAFQPLVLLNARPGMAITQSDLFAPVISVIRVSSDEEAIAAALQCPYALGTSIFGSEQHAASLAQRVPAGVVVVNDMIVPTADPRLPFGGMRRSGFGKTRGAEGLLEMTYLKAIAVQRGKRLRHLEPAHPRAEELFLAFLAASHRRSWANRLRAWKTLGSVIGRK